MNRDTVQSWLDAYVAAWRSNDADDIGALFTDDVVYRYRPYGSDDHAPTGKAAVVGAWLETPDDPDAWEATYQAYAVDGDRAVATGTSRYLATAEEPERLYHNCFLLRFDGEGRCAGFTEFYMEEPSATG